MPLHARLATLPRAAVPASLLLAVAASCSPGPPSPNLSDLDGRPVAPLSDLDAAAVVLIFTATECPIANRYAPTVRRLHERFAARGVRFWLVHPDPRDTPERVRRHLAEFDQTVPALLDPRHELVRVAGATITPEAALFLPGAGLRYRGRIDDRYADLGRPRPEPTRHDLADAVEAVLAGRPVAEPTTKAIGCIIADLQ